MNHISFCCAVTALVFTVDASFGQKLVDPDSVPPEYRAVAEKRRAEQIRQLICAKKAADDKIMRREQAAFINHCIDDLIEKAAH